MKSNDYNLDDGRIISEPELSVFDIQSKIIEVLVDVDVIQTTKLRKKVDEYINKERQKVEHILDLPHGTLPPKSIANSTFFKALKELSDIGIIVGGDATEEEYYKFTAGHTQIIPTISWSDDEHSKFKKLNPKQDFQVINAVSIDPNKTPEQKAGAIASLIYNYFHMIMPELSTPTYSFFQNLQYFFTLSRWATFMIKYSAYAAYKHNFGVPLARILRDLLSLTDFNNKADHMELVNGLLKEYNIKSPSVSIF